MSTDKFLEEVWKKNYPNETDWKMRLLTTNLSLIFVEGELDYNYFYSILNNPSKIKILRPYKDNKLGRDRVCEFVKLLIEDFPERVFGICDRDLLTFNIGNHIGTNIFHTDTHDLELDAVKYSNTNTFLSTKINLNSISPETVINRTLKLCEPIGILRLIKEQRNWVIDFDSYELKYKKGKNDQICDSNYQPNVKVLITRILRSTSNNIQYLQYLAELEEMIHSQIDKHDLFQICNGHDFISALRLIITGNWGLKKSPVDSALSLSAALLGNYHSVYFSKSNLGKELQKLNLF